MVLKELSAMRRKKVVFVAMFLLNYFKLFIKTAVNKLLVNKFIDLTFISIFRKFIFMGTERIEDFVLHCKLSSQHEGW